MSRGDDVAKRALEGFQAIEERLRELHQYVADLRAAFTNYVEHGWKLVEAPKPLDPRDPAIRWLRRTLDRIQERHPDVDYEFVRDDEGRIVGLRFKARNMEEARDVEGPTKWAFKTAARRPIEPKAGESGGDGGSPRSC